MHFLIFLIAVYGMTAGMIKGKPTKPIRQILRKIIPAGDYFVSCYQCMGFWVSIPCFAYCWYIWDVSIYQAPLWILAGSGTAYFLNRISTTVEDITFEEGDELDGI